MNEFDELEDVYFGKKAVADKKELSKLSGLYKYCWWLKPPKQPSVHVPYNLLLYLAKVAPKKAETDYMTQKLREYGYVKDETPPNLQERIQYSLNWTRDLMEIRETAVKLSEKEENAIKELIETLRIATDENQIQTRIFETARKHTVQPSQFFKTLYIILLGTPAGPRLGPYIMSMGRQNVIEALERALGKRSQRRRAS